MKRLIIPFAILLLPLSPVSAAGGQDAAAISELLAEAHLVLLRKTTDKASEKSLEQIVLALASRTETAATRELLEQLATRVPTVFVPHDEGGAMIPYVDVGAAARVTLRTWQRRAASDATRALIQSGKPALLDTYFSANPNRQIGMIEAVSDARTRDLVIYRDELLNRINEAGSDRLAAEMARKLNDVTLYEAVIASASAPVALKTVRQLPDATDADTALSLMRQALGRADIASATVFEIGRLSTTLPAADRMLWELLEDPQLGGSAAAALAGQASHGTVDRLIRLLATNKSQTAKQRIVLALRLSGDEHGRRVADEWLKIKTNSGAAQ